MGFLLRRLLVKAVPILWRKFQSGAGGAGRQNTSMTGAHAMRASFGVLLKRKERVKRWVS